MIAIRYTITSMSKKSHVAYLIHKEYYKIHDKQEEMSFETLDSFQIRYSKSI